MLILRCFALIFLSWIFIGAGGRQDAHAACYEIIGCTSSDLYRERDLVRMSCQILGEVRNSIYAERGYCFKKPYYRQIFGHRNCRYADVGAVQLTRTERANVSAIRSAERIRGCAGT